MFSHVFQSFWPRVWWINGWVLVEIYQFWSNFDGKMGVSAGEMRVLVQFLDVFCGKIVVFDGETRILVQFWMENGCNLPTPPSVSSPNWPLQYVDNIDWDHYHPNWPPFSMLTKLIEITNDPRPKWSFTENTMADIILCVPEERKSLFKPGSQVYTVDVFSERLSKLMMIAENSGRVAVWDLSLHVLRVLRRLYVASYKTLRTWVTYMEVKELMLEVNITYQEVKKVKLTWLTYL